MTSLLVNANALHIPLADGSVHTIVTSPPYYGLRDYGTAKWQGGDEGCDHLPPNKPGPNAVVGNTTSLLGRTPYKDICGKCGAIRIDAQIGLEVTPDAYIANLVEVFRECKRILRDDGTLWANIGDSYVSNTGDRNKVGGFQANPSDSRLQAESAMSFNKKSGDLKSKDLIGIPWMLAFALRADGWYLRQDIIWHKPNPMPESVKDRCTKSHEYIFLLSKSQKYYYDSEAIAEPSMQLGKTAIKFGGSKYGDDPDPMYATKSGNEYIDSGTRNKRDVWTVTTKPYKGAHYATYPPDLITPCILAGAPETCCAKCGAPYVRLVDRVVGTSKPCPKTQAAHEARGGFGEPVGTVGKSGGSRIDGYSVTLGFQPTCTCNAGTSSGIVFDPFVGSGTTVATAIKLGRKGIGIDLNIKYLTENARQRIADAQKQPRLI